MIKNLILGDPHVTVSNLEESERLLQFTLEQAKKTDRLIIMGDLFHCHANVRVEVLEFWYKWFGILNESIETFVLVGNHDQIGNYSSKSHALSVFNNQFEKVRIISSPINFGVFGFIPYIHDKAEFVKEANHLTAEGAKVLFVHEDLDGAQFENGFYCPNGVKQEDLHADLIIGGHIHKRSRFGKVILPGTARWLTSSDKNENKALWMAEFSDEGKIISEQFIDTSHVCTPIYAYQYKEGEAEPQIPAGSRASVELVGSSEWISKQKAKFKGIASVSAKITDKQKPSNRKTGNSLEHFVNNVFEPVNGIKKEKMLNFMKKLGAL
jgi:UDP-2,3-diacylglucosamine pyrophosphatase LpxH